MSHIISPLEDKIAAVESLHKEFKHIENYEEKLKFFDKHFTLIPFTFPSFDVDLDFLLQAEGMNALTKILEKERRRNFSFCIKGSYDNIEFVFDVNPQNSNRHFFNEYIITKFTCNDEYFNDLLSSFRTLPEANKKALEVRVARVNSLIETIRQKIENKKDRTFRKQMFKVFYSGFFDYADKQIKRYPCKRKFIELYLYSMGILFGKYEEALLEQINEAMPSVNVASTNSAGYTLLKAKILLLNELGVTKFLKDKYKNSGETNIENKIAELFSTITGANASLVKDIINYVR